MINPLQSVYGVTTANTGLVFSLAIVSFTVALILAPRIAPGGIGLGLGAVLGAIGAGALFAAARAASFAEFVLWFSVVFGAISGAIYIGALGAAARADAHRIATPVMVATFGLGGAVFGPLWRILDEAGWDLAGLDVLCAAMAAAALWAGGHALTHRTGTSWQDVSPGNHSVSHGATALIWLTFALASFAGLMTLGMAAKILAAKGATMMLASAALFGLAVGNTAGRLSVAGLTQVLTLGRCLYAATALSVLGLGLAILAVSPLLVGVGLVLVATGYGIVASTVPLITRHVFGPDAFSGQFSIVFTAWGVAGLTSPWLAGALFDWTGSFDIALGVGAAVTLACGASAWVLDRAWLRTEAAGLTPTA